MALGGDNTWCCSCLEHRTYKVLIVLESGSEEPTGAAPEAHRQSATPERADGRRRVQTE